MNDASDGAPITGTGDPACWLKRICAECGRVLPDDAERCPACDTPVEDEP